MSNSGNTLNKKTIIAIVIIAVLLIAAIIGVVVFLKDQGETSAMAENGSQTSSDENVQARQEEQEPQEQAQTEEQNADTQNNEQDEPSTEVATTNDGANQGGATANSNDRTNNSGNRNNNSGTTSSSTNNNNRDNNDNDAENIQESVIEDTQTVQTEETVKTEEGEILSWTPQALATVSAIAGNMQLNAPNLVTEKTSTVYNDDGTRAEDQTKIALDQKVTYTIIIENRGNVEGTIEKGKTYDTLPKGFDYSKTRAEDYEFKVEKISATGESTTGDEVLSYSDFKFGKENAALESQTLILDKDVKLGAGEKLFITYSLKVDPKYLEDENGLVANKHIDKNVVTVNNLPVEDKNEYDGVQPLVKVEKTSRILRGEDLKETDIAKIADFIEYTIHIENNGEADTKVTVKDSDLEKILSDGKAEFRSGDKTAEELINGFDVEVAHKDYVDIKFVIEIKDITGAIENGVEVKDTTPQNPDPVVPENPDKVNTVNITATKGIITDGAVYEKDTLTYTITLQNSGNTKGTVSVKDSIPEGLTFKEGSIKINGDETEYTQNDLEDGNIKVTVPGNNGKVVVSFMVTADILDGKESLNIDNTAYVDDEPTNTVTTTVNKAYISVEVNKEWKDNDIQANRRPDKVTFILVADGEDTDTTLTVDVNKTSDKQNYKFEKPIAKYNKDGKPIKYTVREEGMGDFYKSTVSKPSVAENGNTAVTVTNEFKLPEGDKNKTDVTVTKIWDDNNNAENKRPEKVTFKISGLTKNGTIDVTKNVSSKNAIDENTWEITNVELDKYDKFGAPYEYTFEEVDNNSEYVVTNLSKNGNVYSATNTLPSMTVDKKVSEIIKANGDVVTPEDENSKMTVAKDDIIKYTITVTNNTDIPLSNVVVTDKDLQITSDKDGKNPIKDGIVIELTEQLVKGQSATVDVYYKVTDSNFLNDKQITNTVNAEGKYTIDDKEYPVKDSDSETVSVEQVPGISITKTQDITDNTPKNPGYVGEGDVITYTITVKNTGNTDLTNVTVKDVMTNNHGKLNIDEKELTIGKLEKEGTRVITAKYTVTKEDISSDKHNKIANTATVTADGVDDDDSTVTVDTEIGAPDISLEKESKLIKADKNKKTNSDGTPYTGNYNVAEPGDKIRYTITVKNNGNVTGTAKVSDEAPKGTTFDKIITQGIEKVGDGFSTEVELGPEGTASDTKTIVFEVEVTAKPGQKIENTATLNDEKVTEETTHDKVEKTVKVKTNTISNCNVVLVLDTSGSMQGSRMTNVKTAAKNLIDMLKLPAQAEENGPQISVVRYSSGSFWDSVLGGYSSDASVVGTATTSSTATTLKNNIDKLSANGGTMMSEGLKLANQEIKKMDDPTDSTDKNIIIFLSDGSLKGNTGETENNVKNAANALKNNKVENQTVYTVPFGNDADSELLTSIASGPEYCLSSSEDLSSLQAVFNKIINDTSKPVLETSTNGRVYLEDIDMEETDEITITVDGVEKDSLKSYIKYDNTNKEYYLDLKEFNTDDLSKNIQIDYLSK